MPGLVGYISKGKSGINSTLMCDMCDILKHRKWYGVDRYLDEKEGLAISHIHSGTVNNFPQPYLSQDGKTKIFMHGEIYNDAAIDYIDQLDFVYHQYKKKGADFAAELNGSFIVIIIDAAKDRVIIANDRTASKPLFYFVDGQTIYFAPEMKCLLPIPSLEKRLNQTAIANFLAVGYFINGDLLIKNIKILDNASVVEITNSEITMRRYWQYSFDETPRDEGVEYYQKILSKLIHSAVSRRIRTKHRYGILLSGGYDSRGILGCYLHEKGGKNVNTISWGYEEDVPKSDCMVSKKLADELGTTHRFYKLNPQKVVNNLRDFIFLSDGLTDAFTNYPESLKIFQEIRQDQGIQMILRGDECFGWHSWAFDERTMFSTLSINHLNELLKYKKILKDSYYESFIERNSKTINTMSSKCDAKNIHNRKDFFYLDQRLQHYLNPLSYIKSIEVELRNPWVDNDILDFMCTVPIKYRLDKNLYRKTIVKMFPELFSEIAQKSNLIDWGHEFRNSQVLKDFIYKELIESQNAFHEFILIDNLKIELDAFFSNNGHSHDYGVTVKMGQMLRKFPVIYNFAQKWWSKSRSGIPMEIVIIRMLTLKIWCDLFMSSYKHNKRDDCEGSD